MINAAEVIEVREYRTMDFGKLLSNPISNER